MNLSIDKSVQSVKTLLGLSNIVIPAYQRPYKWTLKNVSDLFQDVSANLDKPAYRLGSVVFHQNEKQLDIVDGQQRTLTLVLTVWALMNNRLADLDRHDLKEALNQLRPIVEGFMACQSFSSEVSHFNLHQNYQEIQRLVSRKDDFTEAHIDFLLHKCQVVIFILNDVSEAFQFFDSQNARGRDLEPHDLLKAFHLREFAEHESKLKAQTVAHWERLRSDDLAKLFAFYLFRVRQWAKGKSARYFGKNQTDLFKGVNLDKVDHFPYVESLRIAHHFVDDYNSQYQRKIDHQKMVFPFHLDQMIINGRRFFELAEHYQQLVSEIVSCEHGKEQSLIAGVSLSSRAAEIVKTLNGYEKRTRTGDRYIRTMFDCALIFYIDKFGGQQLSNAIEKLFIWAFSCRIKQEVVQLATIDNYVLANNLFSVIKEAIVPNDVLSFPSNSVKHSDNRNNRPSESAFQDPLVKLFQDMNYYEL